MEHHAINERVASIAAKAADANGVEFVHAETAGTKRNLTVRVFIDKPGGVTIEDCTNVSRAMEEVLDADDFIPSAYVLEISSPGLDRGLYKLDDFVRFTGKKAKIKTSAPINGQANFIGQIVEVEGEEIIFDDRTNGAVRIPFKEVQKANLKVDLADELGKR